MDLGDLVSNIFERHHPYTQSAFRALTVVPCSPSHPGFAVDVHPTGSRSAGIITSRYSRYYGNLRSSTLVEAGPLILSSISLDSLVNRVHGYCRDQTSEF
jgi:hypothetical protein